MSPTTRPRSGRCLPRLLLRGWRKGLAVNDLRMWGALQLSLLLPTAILIAALTVNPAQLAQLLTSPVLWSTPLVGLLPLGLRLHFLATRIGCIRQINVSEDGHPARCLVDLGHPECCRHIAPGAGKDSCPYWRPELVIE
jgi:hypothetical protein